MKKISPNLTVLTTLDANAGGARSIDSCKEAGSTSDSATSSSTTSRLGSGGHPVYGQKSPRHRDLLSLSSSRSSKRSNSVDPNNWQSEAQRLTLHAVSNNLNVGKIDLGVVDSTMTLFDDIPHPTTYPKVRPSQKGLDSIIDFWDPKDAVFDFIEFDHALRPPLLGATVPGAARIGSLAFSDVIEPTAGIFRDGEKSMQLSEQMIFLQVIISAAHENTHLRQYDRYQYVDQDRYKKEFATLPEQLKCKIFNACMDQCSILESLGYQSEVINLLKFHEAHQDYLKQNPKELSQWNELLESSINHRDIHFDRLTEDKKVLFLKGDIDALMNRIHDTVPKKYLVNSTSLNSA